MVRYRRHWVQGGTFFFTVALADRRSTRLVTHVATLRQAFRKARQEYPFDLDAIVVLPDHLHAIFTLPPGDADFSRRWQVVKAAFTRGVRRSGVQLRARDGDGYVLWQRRFWEHSIRDEVDYARHVDYIHFNPVKHGHVVRPADWPHSSFGCFVRRGILPLDWGSASADEPHTFGEPSGR